VTNTSFISDNLPSGIHPEDSQSDGFGNGHFESSELAHHDNLDHRVTSLENFEYAGVVVGSYHHVVPDDRPSLMDETCGSAVMIKTPSNSPSEVLIFNSCFHTIFFFFSLSSMSVSPECTL
jgi:hypothetical protein